MRDGAKSAKDHLSKLGFTKAEAGSELDGVTPELTIATEQSHKFSRDARVKFFQTGAGFWSIYVIHVYHNEPISMSGAKSAKDYF